jgi:hypothetical protein
VKSPFQNRISEHNPKTQRSQSNYVAVGQFNALAQDREAAAFGRIFRRVAPADQVTVESSAHETAQIPQNRPAWLQINGRMKPRQARRFRPRRGVNGSLPIPPDKHRRRPRELPGAVQPDFGRQDQF